MQNIEGYPEARILGFPVGLQAAGALTGGVLAAQQVLNRTPQKLQKPLVDKKSNAPLRQ